jgi:hypothetical protein
MYISLLTKEFLLCFLALRRRSLHVQDICHYLTRKAGRVKSTLCVLYQIAHILDAAGILIRSDQLGGLTLLDPYFTLLELRIPRQNPFVIGALLNPSEEESIVIKKRAQEFIAECLKQGKVGVTLNSTSRFQMKLTT